MTLARWPDADRLLDEALALPAEQRAAWLGRLAETDRELAEALAAVLDEATETDSFLTPGAALGGPIADDVFAALDEAPPALQPGTTLGDFEVLGLAGRGGMGEVYRARDVRLGRLVALKLLPDRFARDPDRLQRFEREARVLAALSHPRIAAIHGVVEHEGRRALALEWVEGETLADRLARGPCPLPEALSIASSLVDALEAAHERGVVHRDLKPANVALGPSGLKVLDFGLAKAIGPDERAAPGPLSTAQAHPGLAIGTAAYMSPEQARGERVDHRADIWAFGCILIELVSGRRAFPGKSAAAVIARVIEGQPDLDGLPEAAPPALCDLIARCLQKEPRRRLGWIGDARALLEAAAAPAAPAPPAARPGRRTLVPVAVALGLGMAAGAVAIWQTRQPPPPPVTRLAVPVPPSDMLVAGDLPTVAITDDGRSVIYRARRDGVMRLFRRGLDRPEPEAIAGTEFAVGPFVSPDGQWVAFSRDGVLYRVPVEGGAATAIAPAPGTVAGAWIDNETIVFGGDATGGLQRVSAAGGTPVPLTTTDPSSPGEVHSLPSVTPDRAHVIFTVVSADRAALAVVPVAGGAHRAITPGRQGRVIDDGLLVFLREGAFWAARLDRRQWSLVGAPGALDEKMDVSAVSGAGHFALAASGTLVYLPQRTERSRLRRLVWIGLDGSRTPVPIEPRAYTRATPSPDGERLALSISSPESRDIWSFTLGRGVLTRLTFEDPVDTAPVWTRDGRFLIFRSDRQPAGMYRIRADGSGAPERVTESGKTFHTPYDVAPDGSVLFTEFVSYRDQRIGRVAPAAPAGIDWLVDGPFADLRPRLSPDGRYLVYQSDESGRFEIYVRPYPDSASARWQVTSEGGTSPLWAAGGREIFYYNDGAILRVPVTPGPAFGVGAPGRVVSVDLIADRLGPVFELMPDGERFLAVEIFDATPVAGQLTLVTHWDQVLRARLAGR